MEKVGQVMDGMKLKDAGVSSVEFFSVIGSIDSRRKGCEQLKGQTHEQEDLACSGRDCCRRWRSAVQEGIGRGACCIERETAFLS